MMVHLLKLSEQLPHQQNGSQNIFPMEYLWELVITFQKIIEYCAEPRDDPILPYIYYVMQKKMLIFFRVWVWDWEAMWWKVRSIYPEQNWPAFMTWLYFTSCVVFDKFFNYSEFWLPYLLKLNNYSYLSRLLQGLNIAINVGIELNTAIGLE